MSRKIDAVIIRRSHDENTVALVTVECDPEMINSVNDLYGAVVTATTRWLAQTADGQEILKDRPGFNVADLDDYLDDPLLIRELEHEGVLGLEISFWAGEPTVWDFDDTLYDPAYLEE